MFYIHVINSLLLNKIFFWKKNLLFLRQTLWSICSLGLSIISTDGDSFRFETKSRRRKKLFCFVVALIWWNSIFVHFRFCLVLLKKRFLLFFRMSSTGLVLALWSLIFIGCTIFIAIWRANLESLRFSPMSLFWLFPSECPSFWCTICRFAFCVVVEKFSTKRKKKIVAFWYARPHLSLQWTARNVQLFCRIVSLQKRRILFFFKTKTLFVSGIIRTFIWLLACTGKIGEKDKSFFLFFGREMC